MRMVSLPVVLAVAVLTSYSQAAILPLSACTVCAGMFLQLGCLETESVICKFLAIKFTTDFSGRKLCDSFLCEGGYGQSANNHECKALASCLITRWKINGICPVGTICCAPLLRKK